MYDLLELLELVEGGFGVWNHMPLGQALLELVNGGLRVQNHMSLGQVLQDVKSHDIPTP